MSVMIAWLCFYSDYCTLPLIKVHNIVVMMQ